MIDVLNGNYEAFNLIVASLPRGVALDQARRMSRDDNPDRDSLSSPISGRPG